MENCLLPSLLRFDAALLIGIQSGSLRKLCCSTHTGWTRTSKNLQPAGNKKNPSGNEDVSDAAKYGSGFTSLIFFTSHSASMLPGLSLRTVS